MITWTDLKKIVENYQFELNWQHPFVTSDKFIDNSYSKWACKEILHEINGVDELPFNLTPIELLEEFSGKMKQYAYMNSKNSLIFTIASETAEYLIEQCWIGEWKSNGRRR